MKTFTKQELEKILKDHSEWLKDPSKGVRADLNGADLSRAYLYGADLRGADLSRAYLYGANLSRANLSDAWLDNANFTNANLSKANFSYAWLYNANFTNANIIGANFKNAEDLKTADFTGAVRYLDYNKIFLDCLD